MSPVTRCGVICIGGEAGAPETTRFRRTVFTELERQAMSCSFRLIMPPCLALQRLAELDVEFERVPVMQHIQIYPGPFRAFRLGRSHCPSLFTHSLSNPASRPTMPCARTNASDSSFACGSSAGVSGSGELLSLNPNEILSLDTVLLDSMVGVPGISPLDFLVLMDFTSLNTLEAQYPCNAAIGRAEIDWPFEPASYSINALPRSNEPCVVRVCSAGDRYDTKFSLAALSPASSNLCSFRRPVAPRSSS
ncbi:unnamed protein product [Penicillium pancosmium]